MVVLKYLTAGTHTPTIPAGATNISLQLWGCAGAGGGGSDKDNGGGGGGGGYLKGNLAAGTYAGEQLTIRIGTGGVAGDGLGTGTYVGDGAGGGGYVWVEHDAAEICGVGAGGGGAGADNTGPGTGEGGGGGGLTGSDGLEAFATDDTQGHGGTSSAGGVGGDGGASSGADGSALTGGPGGTGTTGTGGGGDGGTEGGGEGGAGNTSGYGGGGGAGAGKNGGGGGSSSVASADGGGGGAGGSSNPGVLTSVTHENGTTGTAQSGDGGSAANRTGDWVTGHGDGGQGGVLGSPGGTGDNGELGMVVLTYTPAVGGDGTLVSVDTGTLADSTQLPLRPTSTGVGLTVTDAEADQDAQGIFITNHPTWGSETVKVEQTVTAWGASSITISIVMGALVEGDGNYLWGDFADGESGPIQLRLSTPSFKTEISNTIAMPTGTGVKTVWTPNLNHSETPVKAYYIQSVGNDAGNTIQSTFGHHFAVVCRDGSEVNDLGIAHAVTDADASESRREQIEDADGSANFYEDAVDATSDLIGRWQINATTGALECDISTNSDAGYVIQVTAYAGRTMLVRIKTGTVSDGEIDDFDFPSDSPPLSIWLGTGTTWGSTDTNGISHIGFWDGLTSGSAWWMAPYTSDADVNSILRSSAIAGQFVGDALTWEMTAAAWGAGSGSNRKISWTGSNPDQVGVMAIWTDGLGVETGTEPKEVTGVDDVTQVIAPSLGFDPAHVVLATASQDNEDPTTGVGGGCRFAIGMASSPANGDNRCITSTVVLISSVLEAATRTANSAKLIIAANDLDDAVEFRGELSGVDDEVEIEWTTASTFAAILGYVALENSADVEADPATDAIAMVVGMHW